MDVCQQCRYFRGACLGSGEKYWTVICNWPRDGSFVSEIPDRRPAVPDVFGAAFEEKLA